MLRTVCDAFRPAVRMASSTLVVLLPTTSDSRYTWSLTGAPLQPAPPGGRLAGHRPPADAGTRPPNRPITSRVRCQLRHAGGTWDRSRDKDRDNAADNVTVSGPAIPRGLAGPPRRRARPRPGPELPLRPAGSPLHPRSPTHGSGVVPGALADGQD